MCEIRPNTSWSGSPRRGTRDRPRRRQPQPRRRARLSSPTRAREATGAHSFPRRSPAAPRPFSGSAPASHGTPQWRVPNLRGRRSARARRAARARGLRAALRELVDDGRHGHEREDLVQPLAGAGVQRLRSAHRRDRHARHGISREAGRAASNTTPDAILLHRSLARLLGEGAQGVAMEVTSIGLDQGRVNGVAFGAALFTNLSRDHLDYHGDMESYARAKQRLFETPDAEARRAQPRRRAGRAARPPCSQSRVNRAGYSCFAGVAARAGLECHAEAHAIEVSPEGDRLRREDFLGRGAHRKRAARALQRVQPARRPGDDARVGRALRARGRGARGARARRGPHAAGWAARQAARRRRLRPHARRAGKDPGRAEGRRPRERRAPGRGVRLPAATATAASVR